MIDGQPCAPEDAKVSVFDRGFLYGDSIFETIRTYGGHPFALDEHLARLEASARKVFIPLPVPLTQFRLEVLRTLEATSHGESYIRVVLSRGSGELGLDPALAESPLRVIIVGPLSPPAAELYVAGATAVTFKTLRPADATAAEGAKIGNYLVAVLGMKAARAQGAHEALIVDAQDRVVEGASSNLFFVRGGVLHTPAVDAGILAGITRDRILKAAQSLGIPTRLLAPELAQLLSSEEVFVSSSIRELLPIVRIDDEPVGSGQPGAMTQRLHSEYRRLVDEEQARNWPV